MNRILPIALLALIPAAALAQSPASPPPATSEARPAPSPGTGRGAEIRIERQDLSLFVRCGEGESAKSCVDTVMQLVDKLSAMPDAERRERRGERETSRGDDRRPRDRDY